MTKLLQQALDALIESRDDVDLCYAGVKAARLSFRQERQLGFYEEQLIKHDAAIEALKQALAQQEQCINVPVAHKLAKEQAKTDQTVPPEYLAWLESLYPERNGVGGNEAWNAGIAWFKAQKEHPAQEPVAWYLSEDSNILGVEWSRQKPKYGRDWTPLYKTAPTQPALSESQITSIAYNCNALPEVITDKTLVDFVRAIEAHCRGGLA